MWRGGRSLWHSDSAVGIGSFTGCRGAVIAVIIRTPRRRYLSWSTIARWAKHTQATEQAPPFPIALAWGIGCWNGVENG